MDIKKELLKIFGTKYMFDFTMKIITLLIKKDESNRELIEKELSKMIDKKNKEHMEELHRDTLESAKWDLKNTDCVGGQLSPSKDDMWIK